MRALERRGEKDAAEDTASDVFQSCKIAATAAANDCVTTNAETIARGRTTASAASRSAIYKGKRSSHNRSALAGLRATQLKEIMLEELQHAQQAQQEPQWAAEQADQAVAAVAAAAAAVEQAAAAAERAVAARQALSGAQGGTRDLL